MQIRGLGPGWHEGSWIWGGQLQKRGARPPPGSHRSICCARLSRKKDAMMCLHPAWLLAGSEGVFPLPAPSTKQFKSFRAIQPAELERAGLGWGWMNPAGRAPWGASLLACLPPCPVLQELPPLQNPPAPELVRQLAAGARSLGPGFITPRRCGETSASAEPEPVCSLWARGFPSLPCHQH